MTQTATQTTDRPLLHNFDDTTVKEYAETLLSREASSRRQLTEALAGNASDILRELGRHGDSYALTAASAELAQAVIDEAGSEGRYAEALDKVLRRIRRRLLGYSVSRSTDTISDGIDAARRAAEINFYAQLTNEDL